MRFIVKTRLFWDFSIFLNKKIGKNDPNPIEPEISYQFKKLVHKLEVDGIISLNKACELLGFAGDEYRYEENNYWY